MTTYTTRTAEFGSVTFSAPGATETRQAYVLVEHEDGQRRQICHGGKFLGETVTASTTGLKSCAQQWLRQRRDWVRAECL